MSEPNLLVQLTMRLEIPEAWTPGRRFEVIDSAITKIACVARQGGESGTVILGGVGAIGTWFMTQEPIDDDGAARIRACHDAGRREVNDRDRLGCDERHAVDGGSPVDDGSVA